ncbi:MAG: hypothetical protein ABIH87_03090, partial [bacterium]
SSPTSEELLSIYMLSTSTGWAVGKKGKILYYNGTIWSEHTDTGNEEWNSVFLLNSLDGWIVGDNGNILRWDGNNWNSFSSPTTNNLEDSIIVSNKIAWAVGKSGTIIHFSRSTPYAISGSATSSAFNMGDSSPVQIIEWDEDLALCSPSCDIKMQVRSASDASGSPGIWTDWYGSSGLDTYFSNSSGTLISTDLNNHQWVQYRIELSSNGVNTPVLQEVRVNYK